MLAMRLRPGFGFLIHSADVRAESARRFGIYPSHERQKIYQRGTVRLGVEDIPQTVYDFCVRGRVFFMDEAAHIGFHHWTGNGIGAPVRTIGQLTKDSYERNGIGLDQSYPTLLDLFGIVFCIKPFADGRRDSGRLASPSDQFLDLGPCLLALDFRRDGFLSLELLIKS